MKKAIILIVQLGMLGCFLSATTYVYSERTEGEDSGKTVKTLSIAPRGSGFIVYAETQGEKARYIVDTDFSVIEMHFSNASDESDLRLIREGGRISISGKLDGKPMDRKKEPAGGASWQQEWMAGVNAFSLSPEKERRIFALNLRGDIKEGEFVAIKLPDETIEREGRLEEVRRVVIRLAGLPGRIMRIDTNFWIRKSDGAVLKMTMPKGPGRPLTITELVEVRE